MFGHGGFIDNDFLTGFWVCLGDLHPGMPRPPDLSFPVQFNIKTPWPFRTAPHLYII